jgi:tetratricopeptide (TPR) repeat protein
LIEFSTPKSLFQHRQKELQPIHDFLAAVRSHIWPFDQQSSEKPVQELFRIADLLIAAQKAYSESNFEREFQRVRELARLAGDSPSVIGYVMFVADRYQDRKMGDRRTELLEILAKFEDTPAPVLLLLARDCQAAGNEAKAIDYFDRAVQRSPEMYVPRKSLVDLLERNSEYEKSEPHIHKLIELKPNDSFLRIDLARNLHRQRKVEEARVVIREFLQSSEVSKSEEVWKYLRTSGLGQYVDNFDDASSEVKEPIRHSATESNN